ncbi:hypothetical protein QCA50_008522 [Cerrena zonata]|uniref:Ras modification protein ERF4 n=1 Tax=Cerrena zonata TaxID=2478898 RepID=A0AAW0GE05_9APHY
MTTSPPLFVVPPPSNLELKSGSPADPPTPYTPISVSTSSVHKQIEIQTPPPLPSERTESEMKVQPGDRESGDEQGLAGAVNEERVEGEDHASEGTTQTEMIVAPPNVLPPSPPLTEIEEHETASGNHAVDGKEPDQAHHLAEEDITDWRSSVNGSYEEDDLGEVTPIDGTGVYLGASMQQGGVSQDRLSAPSPRTEPTHPLSLNLKPQPYSPPAWELIEPPETNNSHLTPVDDTFAGGVSGRSMPKSLNSRHLIPKSSYYFGPPPIDSAYGTNPIGHIGVHHPRELIRIERDYSGGELIQFSPVYPLELEGRITPTQFLETINAINEVLISAHSLKHSLVENVLSYFTLQLSRLVVESHYEKEMKRLRDVIEEHNTRLYNPVGLNILWPKKVAFMFFEIEYY